MSLATVYYKAVRPNLASFYDGKTTWKLGEVTTHQAPHTGAGLPAMGSTLCASTVPSDCVGADWPCTMLRVEPVCEVYQHYGNKVSAAAWRVVEVFSEAESADLFFAGNGAEMLALFSFLHSMSSEQIIAAADAARDAARDAALDVAWDAAWDAAGAEALDVAWDAAADAALDAARDAALDVAWDAALDAAGCAAWAILTRDLISDEHYQTLTAPMRAAGWKEVTA